MQNLKSAYKQELSDMVVTIMRLCIDRYAAPSEAYLPV